MKIVVANTKDLDEIWRIFYNEKLRVLYMSHNTAWRRLKWPGYVSRIG